MFNDKYVTFTLNSRRSGGHTGEPNMSMSIGVSHIEREMLGPWHEIYGRG